MQPQLYEGEFEQPEGLGLATTLILQELEIAKQEGIALPDYLLTPTIGEIVALQAISTKRMDSEATKETPRIIQLAQQYYMGAEISLKAEAHEIKSLKKTVKSRIDKVRKWLYANHSQYKIFTFSNCSCANSLPELKTFYGITRAATYYGLISDISEERVVYPFQEWQFNDEGKIVNSPYPNLIVLHPQLRQVARAAQSYILIPGADTPIAILNPKEQIILKGLIYNHQRDELGINQASWMKLTGSRSSHTASEIKTNAVRKLNAFLSRIDSSVKVEVRKDPGEGNFGKPYLVI